MILKIKIVLNILDIVENEIKTINRKLKKLSSEFVADENINDKKSVEFFVELYTTSTYYPNLLTCYRTKLLRLSEVRVRLVNILLNHKRYAELKNVSSKDIKNFKSSELLHIKNRSKYFHDLLTPDLKFVFTELCDARVFGEAFTNAIFAKYNIKSVHELNW